MGTIKLNAKEEIAESVAAGEELSERIAVTPAEGASVGETSVGTWDDPAVLYEDETKADENTRHYVLNNGTAKTVFSAVPANYYDEDEHKWKHIDNSLTEKSDAYENICGKVKTEISKTDKGKAVRLSKADKRLSFEYIGKDSSEVSPQNADNVPETVLSVKAPVKSTAKSISSSAVYEDADKDTDLAYSLCGGNLKENIIVKDKSETYRYLFRMKTEGLKLRLSEDNENLELYTEEPNADGTAVCKTEFTIPAPYMYDAAGHASDDVYYELEPSEEGNFVFAVVASADWINADGRAFPVTIDPQVITNLGSLITKQVQYRILSSGTGSGSAGTLWTDTSGYPDIKVYSNGYRQYRTKLTIKRSLMSIENDRILSVKLILTPIGSFHGDLCVAGNYFYYNSEENGALIRDITSVFKQNTGNFDIYIAPSDLSSLHVDGNFSYSTNGPVIEVEYLTNETTRPVRKTFALAGTAAAELDLATGDMTANFCDVEAENSANGLAIRHIYKKSADDFRLGDNFRLNLHETLIRNFSSKLDADYIYTDTLGDKHGFKEYYYYIDENAKKKYVTVDKSRISVNADGTLSYSGKTVYREYKSASGLKAMTRLEALRYVEYLEQRSDEQKQIDDKVDSYGNVLKEFVLVDKSTGTITHRLRSYLGSPSRFEDFVSYANSTGRILLTESEALAYRSLILQSEALQNQRTSLNHQKSSLQYSEISLELQKQTINNTKVSEEAYNDVNLQHSINTDNISNLSNQITLASQQVSNTSDIITNTNAQSSAISDQIDFYTDKKVQYRTQIKAYYKEYYAALYAQKTARQQLPVNFLTDGKIFKGYNETGDLVAVYDRYENYAIIEYETYNTSGNYRIARIYDNNNRIVRFTYTPDNKLSCITDACGNRTQYTYDGTQLSSVQYDTGETLEFAWSQNNTITAVSEQKSRRKTSIAYSGQSPSSFTYYSLVSAIAHGGAIDGTVQTGKVQVSYQRNTNLTMNYVTIKEDSVRERYYFNTDNNLKEYRLEENNKVTKAEQYEYVPYWNGTSAQTNPRSVTRTAARSSLYSKSLDSYTFVTGDTETTTLDSFDNPVKTTTSAVKVNASGSNTQTTEVVYTYDDEQRPTEEITTVTFTSPAESHVSHKKYFYGATGDVIRTESYTEGEEFTEGIATEETVYDEKGNIVRTIAYNSLDAGSKLYTETEYDEKGLVTAEYDETGRQKTEISYLDGTGTVREEVLPNGSRRAYGYDADGTQTAVTQSTEDGEENSTQKQYTCGAVTKVTSGANTVLYTYDGKRRKTAVYLNEADSAYVTYAYADKVSEDGQTVNKVTATLSDGKETETVSDVSGNVLRVSYDGQVQMSAAYDGSNRLASITDGVTGVQTTYTYDDLDRVTSIAGGGITETYTYSDDGCLTQKSVETDSEEYGYTYAYETNAAKTLASITADGVTVYPGTDMLGRSTGKRIEIAGAAFAEESIAYRKVGDHATNMPVTVRFGGMRQGSFVRTDNLRYKYDANGNISEVWENGRLSVRYGYDALNRLIREDNRPQGKTWTYTYDNNGNILQKRTFAYTVRESAALEEQESEDIVYTYTGDKLLSYGDKTITYNADNPTSYNGKACTWEKGRQLKSFDGVTFSYDGQGRRTAKNTIVYTYDHSGRLLQQSDGTVTLKFLYDHEGILGVEYGGEKYIYRRNVQKDVIAILDSSGNVVVKYIYDAWGNHAVVNASGEDIGDATHIGNRNPIRYRGYYYDTETGLYYLKSRYYDPEVGRFITIDDISYLDPDTINGLNLYAYCGNNPVMRVDPNGTSWWSDFWKGVGNIVGAILVVTAVTVLVAVTAGGAAIALGASTAMVSAIAMGATVGGLAAGAMEIGNQLYNNGFGNINIGSVAFETFGGAAYGAISGVMNATTSGLVRLGMRGAVVALNTGMSGIRTAMNGGSAADILRSMGVSLAKGIALQSVMIGQDFIGGTLTTLGREWTILHKALFSKFDLLKIAGIQILNGVLKIM